ncbi:hypothetical protein AB0L54_36680 [Streptomyces sp. NPDC052196]|uniref:hypothetical protein n=1 Tax=Streptomyces sp. NPDC052196 TaxID=3156691 RepID=UPI003420814F
MKVRFSLSEETSAQLCKSGQRDRDEHRAEVDERKRKEAAEREALPVGTRERHVLQVWATSVQAPEGTA